MSLVLGLALATLFLLLAWIFDPGEYAAWPRVNRAQNGLAVLLACAAVIVGLWLWARP